MTLNRPLFLPLLLLAACCLLGGGVADTSAPSMLIYFVASLCLGSLIYDRGFRSAAAALPRHWLILLGLVWLLPLLQLIPLPDDVWAQLPGREVDAAIRQALAPSGGWYSLTLSPIDTLTSFIAVTLFITLFASVLILPMKDIRILLCTMSAFAFANVVIGAFQLASGGEYFDFHGSAHRINVIGFFANRNHTALFLAGSMAFWTYLVTTSDRISARLNHAAAIATAGNFFLFFGIIGTTSRAGLAMGVAGLLVSTAMALLRLQVIKSVKHVALIAGAALLIIPSIFLTERFANVMQRFDSVSTDLRWTIWEQSWQVANIYLPLGSGLGTFRAAYDRWEPIALVSPQYVNNAHNDYLEILIEAGIPGFVLLVLTILAILFRAGRLAPRIARAKLTSIYLPVITFAIFVMLHSWVDYPMRRLAIVGPMAVCLAILFKEFPSRRKVQTPS